MDFLPFTMLTLSLVPPVLHWSKDESADDLAVVCEVPIFDPPIKVDGGIGTAISIKRDCAA